MPDTTIKFDETLGKVTIVTRSQSSIVIDDPNKSLILKDVSGNKIEMTAEGITITSVGKLVLTAAGDLTADATNITGAAKMAFKATGAASAELSAAGQTSVKGAMVMIN